MDLKNKVVVIAGATGGIGREITKAFAKEKVNLVLVARRKVILDSLKQETEKLGAKVDVFECDLTKSGSVEKFVSVLNKDHKQVDVLINAAGVGVYKPLPEIKLDEWQRSLEVNVTAPFLLIQKLLPLLKKSQKACVLSTGSGMGRVAMAKRSAYCTSKFALRGLMLSLAKEYKKTNIQFCHLTLGSVLTAFGPLSLEDKLASQKKGKKYLDPSWLAHTIVAKIKNDTLEDEVTIYPSHYFAESKKGKTALK
ncbi:hypothetical protein A3D84_05360 [Candidatus Woesebacteria bacterium RIFCSPHIGHO2_02_FULL_42_20]|uniref:Ketoreductase domain-containing protein n=1 Tax=Candidatus Woesebacteria bacterium RIFCSPHIGHO2_12_FULL_41_24 TaxID=1802510 RepID=A0A1F8ARH7_9BACT|nr:MAG: hypothetical protein A2W15_04650 [Candidatus Woesebacteria bacterium RBG_16_41_13]OGM30589.1 MAG: hypothetical protein A2873_00545 [Candidatus Woesebacteria bacterium RIFCSPHIGHO2_01_FULL_42_80]OGM34617.1 MAG: hypothetical protein A3D84_05360 [Candidatus Woesebacteria bacterium RIFCSPHIGHO2_02_FULL_42_20]OGM53785.1 MAG: hypothetical protein A3E44_05195 [Candidatus Woesebacteria bacterium RIFCSPHIGHO2_12_FULL_41_24]OGM71192.1 MAG: hypothetical protein A3I55_05220 [Candidatus Woesebacteri